jgi:hypothetical protein
MATFTCECNSKLFYGQHCEMRVDLCANQTCSNNGYCSVVNNEPTCVCFAMYNGSNCEIKSAEKQRIENVISAASIIAIVCIIGFYLVMVLSDVDSMYRGFLRRRTAARLREKTPHQKVQSVKRSPTNENQRMRKHVVKKTHLDYIPL